MSRIIVYGYPASPYYQKVLLTLAFCGLEYDICPQPRALPRPDFESIGINYRRIPLLSIGSDLYADTSLVCSKLCALAGKSEHKAFEHMGKEMFPLGASLIPFNLIADPAFLKDRTALTGRSWDEKTIKANRPAALSAFLSYAAKVDEMLKDGDFVNGSTFSMADIHLLFIFQWILVGHKGAEPEVSPSTHPKIYAWVKRCLSSLPRSKAGKIKFDEARKVLQQGAASSGSTHAALATSAVPEPTGIKVGDQVTVTPVDTGRTHPQAGTVDFISAEEICVLTSEGIHIHFPRIGYAVRPQKASKV